MRKKKKNISFVMISGRQTNECQKSSKNYSLINLNKR